ncbi:Nucleotidyltransferase family protein OS=Streptomyces alboniger OX=132473 GN=CP975_28800 PE=4 SV=1 [Streptomyces alboniger]
MTRNAENATPDHATDERQQPVTELRPAGGPIGVTQTRHDAPVEELPPDLNQAILEAAKQVGALLKRNGHDFALAGSVAVYAHGGAGNLQHDADFCIKPEDAEQVAATLAEAGLTVYQPPEDWLLKAKCLGQDIDLIFELAHQPVTADMLARATELPVDSVRMPVLAPTDLMRALLAAFSEHHCDFGAVLPIARQLRELVDWETVRRDCGDAPMPAAFLYLLERLQVVAPRGGER